MTQGERIKLLRKALKLSQQSFGDKLSVSKVAISDLENGKTALTERNAKAICREYSVDYFWLTEGVGEMFVEYSKQAVDQLCDEYDLDDADRLLVEAFAEADKVQRKMIMNFLQTFAKKLEEQKKDEDQ